MCFYFPRLILIVCLRVVYTLPQTLLILILKLTSNMLIKVPQLMQKSLGVMFWGHTIVQLNLKITRSIVTIRCPHPSKYTLMKQSQVIYINNHLMVRKMFIHEPIHDSFTPFLAVIIPRKSKKMHN